MCWIHSASLFDRMAILHGMECQAKPMFPLPILSPLFQRILPPGGSMGECAAWCHRKLTPVPCHARHAPPHLMQSPFSGVRCTPHTLYFQIFPSEWKLHHGVSPIATAEEHSDHAAVDWALFLLLHWSHFVFFCDSTHFCHSFVCLTFKCMGSSKITLDWCNCFIDCCFRLDWSNWRRKPQLSWRSFPTSPIITAELPINTENWWMMIEFDKIKYQNGERASRRQSLASSPCWLTYHLVWLSNPGFLTD